MFSFFFVNLKMITVFTLLDVFCFFIYIYIYIISLPVMYSLWFAHLEASAIASENEHWTWTGGTSPRRGERRAAVKAAVFVFFCFAPFFFFFLSVLFWTDMDLMLARETNQRCLFGLVFFFPPPFVISFLYFHCLSRGSLIILLMKICSGQNIFVVIKQWTS